MYPLRRRIFTTISNLACNEWPVLRKLY